MNDGENSVFPIQVSLQELLLFLGAVIFIGLYKTTVLYLCPNAKCVNCYISGQLDAGNAPAIKPYPKMEIEGEDQLPHPGP
jgi:hypothetical protein